MYTHIYCDVKSFMISERENLRRVLISIHYNNTEWMKNGEKILSYS